MKRLFLICSFYSLALFLSLSFFFTIYYILNVNAVAGVAVSGFILLVVGILVADDNFVQDIQE
ncbi:MAG TPA: hypothetical protein ENJ45_06385 [Phaeodactylibacter sp.]|nr:hypothetical protein [Phaeodactylibacter sp.]